MPWACRGVRAEEIVDLASDGFLDHFPIIRAIGLVSTRQSELPHLLRIHKPLLAILGEDKRHQERRLSLLQQAKEGSFSL